MSDIERLTELYAERVRKAFAKIADEQDATKVVQANMEFSYVMYVYHFLLLLKAIGAELNIPQGSWDKIEEGKGQ